MHHARYITREGAELADISVQVRQTYLQRRIAEVEGCREALEKNDWAFIVRAGHKMKGNAETFGFDRLALIGNKLEIAAESRNVSQTVEILNQLARVLEGFSADSEY